MYWTNNSKVVFATTGLKHGTIYPTNSGEKIPFQNLRRVLNCIFVPPNLVAVVELMIYVVDLYTYLLVSKLFFI